MPLPHTDLRADACVLYAKAARLLNSSVEASGRGDHTEARRLAEESERADDHASLLAGEARYLEERWGREIAA